MRNKTFGCKEEKIVPLFHANLFLYKVLPSLWTRNGPSSAIAPAPREEHPGPEETCDPYIWAMFVPIKFEKKYKKKNKEKE